MYPCRKHTVALVPLLLLLLGSAAAQAQVAPPVSLAQTYREGVDVGAYWVSEKLDGVYAHWDGNVLVSRAGNRFNAPPWFVAGFPPQPLAGELWMGRGTFDELSGVVRRKAPEDTAWRQVRFMVFDLPSHPEDFTGRLQRLEEIFATLDSSSIGLVEQRRVASHDALMALLDAVVEQGGEGLMLRRAASPHRAGRSADLLKLKRFDDAEAVVVAHLPGKGKFAGMLGALLLELPDGRRFRVGTGFTNEQRKRPPPLGTTVTYKHTGHTSTGLPRFASFLRVREERPPQNAAPVADEAWQRPTPR